MGFIERFIESSLRKVRVRKIEREAYSILRNLGIIQPEERKVPEEELDRRMQEVSVQFADMSLNEMQDYIGKKLENIPDRRRKRIAQKLLFRMAEESILFKTKPDDKIQTE